MEQQNLSYNPKTDLVPICDHPFGEGCNKVVTHNTDISVPIKIKPNARVGKIEAECCGEPKVCTKIDEHGNSCEISIVQKLSIKIPIKYNITTCVGESEVDCECGCDK